MCRSARFVMLDDTKTRQVKHRAFLVFLPSLTTKQDNKVVNNVVRILPRMPRIGQQHVTCVLKVDRQELVVSNVHRVLLVPTLATPKHVLHVQLGMLP